MSFYRLQPILSDAMTLSGLYPMKAHACLNELITAVLNFPQSLWERCHLTPGPHTSLLLSIGGSRKAMWLSPPPPSAVLHTYTVSSLSSPAGQCRVLPEPLLFQGSKAQGGTLVLFVPCPPYLSPLLNLAAGEIGGQTVVALTQWAPEPHKSNGSHRSLRQAAGELRELCTCSPWSVSTTDL